MASELQPIDITTIPELAQLADEVQRTRKPRVLRRDNRDVAVLMPALAPMDQPEAPTALRFPKGGVVAATAGIVPYDGPALTSEEERDAFERGVAAEVTESLGG